MCIRIYEWSVFTGLMWKEATSLSLAKWRPFKRSVTEVTSIFMCWKNPLSDATVTWVRAISRSQYNYYLFTHTHKQIYDKILGLDLVYIIQYPSTLLATVYTWICNIRNYPYHRLILFEKCFVEMRNITCFLYTWKWCNMINKYEKNYTYVPALTWI